MYTTVERAKTSLNISVHEAFFAFEKICEIFVDRNQQRWKIKASINVARITQWESVKTIIFKLRAETRYLYTIAYINCCELAVIRLDGSRNEIIFKSYPKIRLAMGKKCEKFQRVLCDE